MIPAMARPPMACLVGAAPVATGGVVVCSSPVGVGCSEFMELVCHSEGMGSMMTGGSHDWMGGV